MKPFNLEAALMGEPVVTRDGRKVLELHLFEKGDQEQPLYALVEGDNNPSCYTKNGEYFTCDTSCEDLFMGVKTVKGWIAVRKEAVEYSAYKRRPTTACYATLEILKAQLQDHDKYTFHEIEIEA